MDSRPHRPACVRFVLSLVLVSLFGSARGDVEPTSDPAAPSVETDDGVRFTLSRVEVDGVEAASVRYQVEVEFDGAREHTLAVFVWTEAEGGQGRWVRRAYYNSQYQGSRVVATPTLPTGRKLLLVAYYKDGDLPEDAGQWKQAKLGESHVTKVSEEKPHPDVRAAFGDGKTQFVKATLRPASATPTTRESK